MSPHHPLLLLLATLSLPAQVTSDRLLRPDREPQNWLTYSGAYHSQRYSLLDQITVSNARNLELTTAADVLFTGRREGYSYALNARTGAVLWKTYLGGQIAAGPIAYQVGSSQYVAIASGHSLFTFALPTTP